MDSAEPSWLIRSSISLFLHPDSEKLAQKGLGRNNHWPMDAKTVGLLIREVHNQLKGVGRLGLSLEVAERRREARFTHFDLH